MVHRPDSERSVLCSNTVDMDSLRSVIRIVCEIDMAQWCCAVNVVNRPHPLPWRTRHTLLEVCDLIAACLVPIFTDHCLDFSGRGHPIISCDYCRLHWHMDCLDPPMAVPPMNGRRWMCPNHASHSIVCFSSLSSG